MVLYTIESGVIIYQLHTSFHISTIYASKGHMTLFCGFSCCQWETARVFWKIYEELICYSRVTCWRTECDQVSELITAKKRQAWTYLFTLMPPYYHYLSKFLKTFFFFYFVGRWVEAWEGDRVLYFHILGIFMYHRVQCLGSRLWL